MSVKSVVIGFASFGVLLFVVAACSIARSNRDDPGSRDPAFSKYQMKCERIDPRTVPFRTWACTNGSNVCYFSSKGEMFCGALQ